MMRRFSWSILALLVVACSGRAVPDTDAGRGTDAGPSGPMDAGLDAGPTPVDAGPPDAGPDAGPPDAGPPPCACPPYPTSCAAPAAASPTFSPDAEAMGGQLFDVIACADSTLQIAIYEFEWDCLRDAIQTALDEDEDLEVEIVVDDDMCPPSSCPADTLTPGDRVTVVRDGRSGLMHHKWVIADASRVWISSANFTYFSFCVDHNNAIVVDQPEIVAAYGEVFTRMFTEGIFGPIDASEGGPRSGGEYTVYYSPESPATTPAEWQDEMVAAIGDAATGIELFISAWTRTEVSDALVAAHERGVPVRALVSHRYADDAPAQALLAAGVDIRRGNIHDKTIVIDDTVVTGSANWSMNAWSNNENSLWIADADVAAAYRAEFDAVYADAEAVEAP
ncbi:MAG TPA: phospholipase D-like domain-containing protein [Sandaracinaceae bacterium LLY-WYZ-13_1]|nr:phospholipase D-like domain-containing protein [Sandaracinaceae bacterium LLY-WYZ-13_1]